MTARIALFGGSFNPPHLAHQMVCMVVLETCDIDAVWMVPTYRHAFSKELIDYDERCRMCELAAAVFGDRVVVSRIEAELDQPVNRTLDTLLALRERHDQTEFHLVVGTDILAETGKWYRWDDVVSLAPPIAVGRAGYDTGRPALIESGRAHRVIDIDLPPISSTDIRQRLASGKSTRSLLPRSVMDHIAARALYR